ncbi:MAG: low molecular weight protein arginine phosphatase [Chloroflexi bacterium]|nr:low molecular weight protein arginine phosphatase [Chloroflexota bacterium]
MSHLVLFVCTGNVCRSPMAEALFNAQAQQSGESHQYIAQSAGTWALDNQPASTFAITSMGKRHLDLSCHRGRTITRAMLEAAAVVIVMTKNHAEALRSEFPAYRKKLHLMSELQSATFDIGDPYGGTLEEYESCAQHLEKLIEVGYSKIKAWISNSN